MEHRPYNLSMVNEYGIEIAVVYGHLWLQCLTFNGEYETQLFYIDKFTGLSRKEVLIALDVLVDENLITREKVSPQKHKFTICNMDKYPLRKKKKIVTYSY